MNDIGRFGVLFFDDPLYVKIFLAVCLVVLAVYLFFLQGKLFILGFNLAWKSSRRGLIKVRPKSVSLSVAAPTAPVAEAVPTEAETPLAAVPEVRRPFPTDPWPSIPAAVDAKEAAHTAKVVDRIKGRYFSAEKKLKLLKVLWIVIAVLTVIFIITY